MGKRKSPFVNRPIAAAVTGAMAFVMLGTGCAGRTYSQLVSEVDAHPWASLRENWLDQPSRTVLVPTRIDKGPMVNVALHECGVANGSRTIVLVHGVFSDHSMWRFVAGDLSRDSRLLLVDLPGCGASSTVSPHSLGPAGYSPSQLAERIAQAIESWISEQSASIEDAPRLTLVGHSLGGRSIL